jgi:hypothetical protein
MIDSELKLIEAISAGGNITLDADIVLSNYIEIRDKNITINLNGHKITHPASSSASYKDVFEVYGNSVLTIEGDGELIAEDGYCVYAAGDSTVILNGGKYLSPVSAVDARKNAIVTINGGEYKVDGSNNPDGDFGQKYTLNLRDKTGKYETELANFIVKGGKFYKYNPAESASEPTVTNFVADGYKSIKKGDYFEVKKINNMEEKKFVDFAGLDYFWEKARTYVDSCDSELGAKLSGVETDVNTHKDNSDIHITCDERTAWNAAKDAIDAFMLDASVEQDAIDTLKELQNYINTDGEAANALINRVAALEEVKHVTVDEYKATDDLAKANAASLAVVNGDETLEGSIAKAKADAIAAAQAKIDGLDLANTYEAKGEAAKLDAALKTELQAYADQAEADAVATAKAYAETYANTLFDSFVFADESDINGLFS